MLRVVNAFNDVLQEYAYVGNIVLHVYVVLTLLGLDCDSVGSLR